MCGSEGVRDWWWFLSNRENRKYRRRKSFRGEENEVSSDQLGIYVFVGFQMELCWRNFTYGFRVGRVFAREFYVDVEDRRQEISIYKNEEKRLLKKEIWEILIYEKRIDVKLFNEEINKLFQKKERGSGKCCGRFQES